MGNSTSKTGQTPIFKVNSTESSGGRGGRRMCEKDCQLCAIVNEYDSSQGVVDGPRKKLIEPQIQLQSKTKEPVKEQPKEQPKLIVEPVKEHPKEQPKEQPKDQPKEIPKEQPKEIPNEQPKEDLYNGGCAGKRLMTLNPLLLRYI